ncbi:MGMT family protein [Patescibacteria group bacterium]|nr:MGMT family protein [Patescibacteria group bacterium]
MTIWQQKVYPVRKFKKKQPTNISRVSKFSNGVYSVVKKIPRGKVLTYGEVAQKLGGKNLARAVGNALNKNRDKLIPCHRVVRSDGRVGGFNFGTARKIKLLKKENIKIKGIKPQSRALDSKKEYPNRSRAAGY